MLKSIAAASPRLKARIAGVLYLFSLITAACTELFLHGKWNFVGGYIAIAGMAALTLLFYDIFKPVNRHLSFLAASFNFVALTFEALRWQPQGVNVALVCTGFYCIVIGYLMFKSKFLPQMLGVLMAFAGLAWLTFVSTRLANNLSPYNVASGILGEISVFVWLLAAGVNVERWQQQASAAGHWR
jgi:hypothetical protein